MRKSLFAVIWILLLSTITWGQVHAPKEVIRAAEIYELGRTIGRNGGVTINCRLTPTNITTGACPQTPVTGPRRPLQFQESAPYILYDFRDGRGTRVELRFQPNMTPAVLVQAARPVYPRGVWENGISGSVTAIVNVAEGRAKKVEFIRKAGNGFESAVKESLKEWRFNTMEPFSFFVTVEFLALNH